MSAHLGMAGFDRELALSRVGGDTELLKEIADIFLTDYPQALTELRNAIETSNAPLLERAAHGLKGSVANFGASAAVDAALRLEKMGFTRNLSGAAHEIAVLDEALNNLHGELKNV